MPPGPRKPTEALMAHIARKLPQARPMTPAPVEQQNLDVDRAYWYTHAPVPPRQGRYEAEDDTLYRIPTQEEAPPGANPQNRAWVTGNLPVWNEPGYWSTPFEETYTVCVPTWEEEYQVGTLISPEMSITVIESVSYECISGLAQFDIFEWALYRPGKVAQWEDMIIDPLTANPSLRHVFAGHVRPLPLIHRVDRGQTAWFTVKARGIVDLAGLSNHNPGDPLIPNANFRLNVQGWRTQLRRNVDGGPRPTDLGNMEFMDLDPERWQDTI